jgi:hypothetical protein
MRLHLAALAAVTVLALAGCYESKALLLDPGQAAAPLATGSQTLADEGDRPQSVQISLGPDRWYRVRSAQDGDKESRVLFTPLADAPAGRWFAFAYGDQGAYVYGVAEQREGRVYLDLPFCDLGPTRDIAIAHGVRMASKGAMSPACTFEKATDLAGALADYARRPGKPKLPNLPAAP